MRVFIWPEFAGEDKGDGGVRRVVEAQRQYLPDMSIHPVRLPGDADILACHITAPEKFLTGTLCGKPLVAHCHGLYWEEWQWESWAYKANSDVLKLICSADVTTAPAEWVADVIRRHTSRDVRVVHHGVNVDEWSPGENGGYVLWNKTRVDPICEVDSLNSLVKAMPKQQFVSTFGDDARNIELTGRLPFTDAKRVIQSAGAYLCTTRETFGIGTLEAMASGVPIVGYDFGGQTDIVRQNIDGILVRPGDIGALRTAVEEVLGDRERFSMAARERAEQFTWENAVKGYRDIYNEVMSDHYREEKQPRTTIIVPAYNLAKYLPDTLDSVLAQTDDDWECIIVDDASPDACGKIADDYAKRDRRFRVRHNKKNLYLSEARNVGITMAKGRYILPLDADDMLDPAAVEILADALDADRTLSVAYGNVRFMEEDGRTPSVYPPHDPGHSGWPIQIQPWQQVQGWNYLPYASMYRRNVWAQTGGYRRRLRTSEDADFWTRAVSYGYRVSMVTPHDTLIYRNREGSMSRSNREKRLDYVRWYPWSRDDRLAPAGLAGAQAVSLCTPTISVIIPVGPGHQRVVQDAIDSVAAQTIREWECIVVNDTGKPLQLPSWVRVVNCDKRDVGAARNRGISVARGEFFLPLDADDYLQPEALEMLLSAARETGKVIYPDFWEDPETEGVFKHYELRDWNCQTLIQRGMTGSVVALTPVAAWREVGGYATDIGWEDYDFQLRLAEAGVCSARMPVPLFTYRKWTGTRRHHSEDEFAKRKDEILARWRPYFEGGKQFMGCGCGGGSASPKAVGAGSSTIKPAEDAVLIEYTGDKKGAVAYRGATGTIYRFQAGDPAKYVLSNDAEKFLQRKDFRVVAELPIPGEPVLAAV